MLRVFPNNQNNINFYTLIFLSLFYDDQIGTERFYALTVTQVPADQSACSTNYVMQVNQSQHDTNRSGFNQSIRSFQQSKT